MINNLNIPLINLVIGNSDLTLPQLKSLSCSTLSDDIRQNNRERECYHLLLQEFSLVLSTVRACYTLASTDRFGDKG